MAFDLNEIVDEITDQYQAEDNNRPWIVAFSGGKDSTTLLQLVWQAVKKINKESRRRDVYVVCNNTLVENPKVLEYVEGQLKLIEKAAFEQSMPVHVNQTTPKLQDSFWVNLIGKGYPAPNNIFRWCTDRLKIRPTTHFIKDTISQHGEVILLLGTRSDESSNRARSIKKYEVKGSRLRKHSLPNAFVFAPLKDIKTKEIWQFLLQHKCPWGGNNRDLVAMYRNASNDEDCPLITDITTPSCGNSRFGCWVCTVVNRDKSMEALIDSGESWMEPLVLIRDFLANTINRDSPNYDPHKYRMPVRRTGEEGLGPYWPKYRKYILEEVLKAQKQIQLEEDREASLISIQELIAIQVTWNRDYIFEYNVSEIYNNLFGRKLDIDGFSNNLKREKDLLKESCEDEENFTLINNLLKAQRNKILLVNKRGLQNDLENLIEEYLYPTVTNAYKKDRS